MLQDIVQDMKMKDRHSKVVAREKVSSKQALGRLMEQLRSSLGAGYSMGRVWLEHLSVRRERTLGTSGANCESVGDVLRVLRYAAMIVLMMVGGVGEMWGEDTDYSGTYYIASDYQTPNTTIRNYDPNPTTLTNNFYLCPTENWISFGSSGGTKDTWTTGDDNPFLTTYKARLHANDPAPDTYDLTKAKWTIEYYTTVSGKDYYYFKHGSGKYMVLNKQIDGMKGSSPENRIRVHLEELTPEQLADETTRNMALFTITQDNRSIFICPKNQSSVHLTVNNGNNDHPYGYGNNKGTIVSGSTTYGMEGTIGIYGNSNTDDNKYLYLEDYITRPTITYNEANDEITIIAVQLGVDLIYTTDGSIPSTSNPNAITITGTSGNTTTVTFNPADGETTIKAVAVVNGELSNVAKFITPVFFGSQHKYLIQSQNDPWNTTDFHFYMIPGDEDANSILKVNTTSLFRPTMEWYFLNAGIEGGVQYYYIVNNSAKDNSNYPYYLCYDATNTVHMETYSEDNKFKFSIVESATVGTYLIKPYGQNNNLNKDSSNSSNKAINLNNGDNENTRWKFIVSSDLDKTPPFNVSDNSSVTFYKIKCNGDAYYVMPPTIEGNKATASNTPDATANWLFEEAQAATNGDWCTYYLIKNVVTGEYLYYSGPNPSNNNAAFEMRTTYDNSSADKERYWFTWAHSTTTDYYFIVPYLLRDEQQNNISSLNRNNTTLRVQKVRATGTSAWMFEVSDITVAPPIIQYDAPNNKIIIKSTNIGATIQYTTGATAADDPTALTGTTYSSGETGLDLPDNVNVIKAIAVVGENASTVTSYIVPVHTTTDLSAKRTYQIQNVQNNHFYFVPSNAGETTPLNTISLPKSTMEWYFVGAEPLDYDTPTFNIINNSTGEYLYFNDGFYSDGESSSAVMKSASTYSASNRGYRFKFVPYYESSELVGYHITPVGQQYQNFLYKNSDNSYKPGNLNNDSWNISTNNVAGNTGGLWNFVKDKPAKNAFVVSATNVEYYKIESLASAGSFIVPPASGNTGVTTTTATDDENSKWFFKLADDTDPWLNYYYIVNAVTGNYLYFSKADPTNTGDQTNALAIYSPSDKTSETENRYQFAFASTTTDGVYYIVPRLMTDVRADVLNDRYYGVWRENDNALRTRMNRADNKIKWTLSTTTFKCDDPVVTYDNDNDRIVISSTQGANVYYTINGGSNTLYEDPIDNTNTGTPQIIRAVCARSTDGSDNSDVVTIILNPNITLEEESVTLSDASVTYDGGSHQPTISSAEYNSSDITSECTLAKYLDAEGNVVSECVNAGEYIVVITDVADGDYYVYGTTTFTINPASLTITPDDDQKKEYGDPDPVLTYTSSGLIGSDELTGSLSRDEGETVEGTYAITQGTLGNSNYEISFTTGKTFTITKKSLGDNINTPAPNITCDITETGGTHSIVVKQCGNDLTLDTDYAKEGEDDGIKYYQVTVTGTGNYKDGFSVKLAKIQLSKLAGSSAPGGAALFVSNSDDYDFVVPDNMAAYIVTGISGNTLVTEQLDNIPSQEPVLLISTIDANGFLVKTTTGTAPTGTNLLKEVTDDPSKHFETAKIYLLYNGEFVLNMAGDLAKGKIYLPRPSGAPSRLFIVWEQPTAIDAPQLSTVNSQLSTDTWYTLDGRKLSGKPTQKGLYIVNGKKVMVE